MTGSDALAEIVTFAIIQHRGKEALAAGTLWKWETISQTEAREAGMGAARQLGSH